MKISEIPSEMKENANSIILEKDRSVFIEKKDKVVYKNKIIVLILNEQGYDAQDFSEFYDKSIKIKDIGVKVYNAFGLKTKEIKRSDFSDTSVADGVSVFNDNRMLSLNYKPISYPIIIEFNSEVESKNTAFLSGWSLYDNLNESCLSTVFNLTNNTGIKLNYYQKNLEKFNIKKSISNEKVTFEANNISAFKPEQYANYSNDFPIVKFSLANASLEGYEFDLSSWTNFGKNYYESFLKSNSDISNETKAKLDKIISDSDTKVQKIKKIYKYIQDNTRYVSVQVGVGGWKPMLVSDVEKYGYGDCKALSNFARASLKAYGIESFYTIIFGGDKKDINEELVSFQGNHVILSIPDEKEFIHLECTNQTSPFAYLSTFTSNRKALIVKPDGAEIINTTQYKALDNSQNTYAEIKLLPNNEIKGNLKIVSKNIQYNSISNIENKSAVEQIKYYKNHFSYLNEFEITNLKFVNNKDEYTFTEQSDFGVKNYYYTDATSTIVPLNIFNKFTTIPAKYRSRNFSFKIDYGYVDQDEIKIEIPNELKVVHIPNNVVIEEKFGEYKVSVLQEGKFIVYHRYLKINEGVYSNEDYEHYRKFREQINKEDQLKIVLEKKQ
jgi:hypothetical protein